MRFCVHCGAPLDAHPAQPAAQPAAAPNPPAAVPAQGDPAPRSETSGGPVCWRCRGVGDAGHEFCKFCGARYTDAPGGAAPQLISAPGPVQAPPAPSAHAPAPVANQGGGYGPGAQPGAAPRLVSIRKDGTDGTVYPVQSEICDIGRYEGDVRLEDDPYLSARHARIRRHNGRYYLRDLDSINGVYVRLREPVELRDSDHFLIGQQVFRYELLGDSEQPLGPARLHGVLAFGTPEVPRFARLLQYTTEGLPRDIYYIYRDETVLGRENGDIVFTDDPFLSRRHAVLTIDRAARRAVLKDLSSSNGTSIRIREEQPVSNGDQFRVGRHLFRFDHPESR